MSRVNFFKGGIMDRINRELLRQLRKKQYSEFLKYALGLKEYLGDTKRKVVTKTVNKSEIDNYQQDRSDLDSSKIFAYCYQNEEMVDWYYLAENDHEELKFSNKYNERLSVEDYFDNIIPDSFIWILLLGVINIDFVSYIRSQDNKERVIMLYKDINDVVKRKTKQHHDFILGAGVNIDYKIGSWASLINAIENEISIKTGISIADVEDFESRICNTNYIAPQILKNMNENQYYQIIYDSLYSLYGGASTPNEDYKRVEDTNLYQVARIASNQKQRTRILTFNYDCVLEDVLTKYFPQIIYNRLCKGSKKSISGSKIDIVHSHGYMDKKTSSLSYGIILSSFEYMEGYRHANSYPRKNLSLQLQNDNYIIGNSLCDYEEQKDFFDNHKSNSSHYDIMLTTYMDKGWEDATRIVYFFKLGVIPMLFNDFGEMNDFLKSL